MPRSTVVTAHVHVCSHRILIVLSRPRRRNGFLVVLVVFIVMEVVMAVHLIVRSLGSALTYFFRVHGLVVQAPLFWVKGRGCLLVCIHPNLGSTLQP